jgi:hypothetical protein
MKWFPLVLVGLALLLVQAAEAQPEPAAGGRWSLELSHGPLKIVAVDHADGSSTTYHYITLRVSNPTALARPWYPMVKAHTDTDRTYVASGFAHALGAIREAEGDDALQAIETTTGRIPAGQTLETVAILGPLDPLYDRVRIHVHGLADPIAIYKVARYDEGDVIQDIAYAHRNREVMDRVTAAAEGGDLPDPEIEYQEIAERRVYEMIYERLGDEFRPDEDEITHESEQWTIVGEPKTLRVIEVS